MGNAKNTNVIYCAFSLQQLPHNILSEKNVEVVIGYNWLISSLYGELLESFVRNIEDGCRQISFSR